MFHAKDSYHLKTQHDGMEERGGRLTEWSLEHRVSDQKEHISLIVSSSSVDRRQAKRRNHASIRNKVRALNQGDHWNEIVGCIIIRRKRSQPHNEIRTYIASVAHDDAASGPR